MELKDKLAKIASYTLIGAAALPIVSCREKVEEKKMNILFIMCDDHSYQTISAYDQRYIDRHCLFGVSAPFPRVRQLPRGKRRIKVRDEGGDSHAERQRPNGF